MEETHKDAEPVRTCPVGWRQISLLTVGRGCGKGPTPQSWQKVEEWQKINDYRGKMCEKPQMAEEVSRGSSFAISIWDNNTKLYIKLSQASNKEKSAFGHHLHAHPNSHQNEDSTPETSGMSGRPPVEDSAYTTAHGDNFAWTRSLPAFCSTVQTRMAVRRTVSVWFAVLIRKLLACGLWWLVGNIACLMTEAVTLYLDPKPRLCRNPGKGAHDNDPIYRVGWHQRGPPCSRLATAACPTTGHHRSFPPAPREVESIIKASPHRKSRTTLFHWWILPEIRKKN